MLKALGLPMQQFLRNPHQALPSITAVAVWRSIGFAIIIFLAGLQQIPEMYYEAAQIDGANRWQIFWRITLPLLNPVIVYLAVLQTIGFLRMFDLVQNMTERRPAQQHDDGGAGGLQRGLRQLQHGLCRGADGHSLWPDLVDHRLPIAGAVAPRGVLSRWQVSVEFEAPNARWKWPNGGQQAAAWTAHAASRGRLLLGLPAAQPGRGGHGDALCLDDPDQPQAGDRTGAVCLSAQESDARQLSSRCCSTSDFGRWYFNSLLIACISTASVAFFDSLVGYTLNKFEFPGKNIIFVGILATLMVPTEMLIIPWFNMSVQLGWNQGPAQYWGIVFPGVITAVGIFLMRQFFDGVPNELLDAARIDGVNEFGIFWRVAMPLVKPAIAALCIFNFIGNWNAYLWPLIIASGRELLHAAGRPQLLPRRDPRPSGR